MSNPVQTYFNTIPIEDILSKKKLETITPTASLRDVAYVFQNKEISWLPIRERLVDRDGYRCIHLRDLSTYLISLIPMEGVLSPNEAQDIFTKLKYTEARELCHEPWADEIFTSGKDFKSSTPLSRVIEEMSSRPSCTHVPVVNDLGELHVVSQWDIFYQLSKHKSSAAMKWAKETPLLSMTGLDRRLVSMDQNAPVVDVLRRMRMDDISGVCLVADNNMPVGGFGSSDLFPFFESDADLMRLNDPVNKFLSFTGRSTKPITLYRGDATLEDVITTFVSNKVHCVFLTNDIGQATGIVTCSDVIKSFAQHCVY